MTAPTAIDAKLTNLLGTQATRSRILRGAAQVFGTKEVDAVTVQDILGAAGISRRTFYQFFRNKEETLYALFEITTALIQQVVLDAASSSNWVERHAQQMDAYLAAFRGGGPLSLVLQTEAMRAGSPLGPLREQTLDALAEHQARSYEEDTGEAIDPLMFRAFFLTLEGLLTHAHRDGPADDTDIRRIRRIMRAATARTLAPGLRPLPDLPTPDDG